MSIIFHVYGEIVLKGTTYVQGTISQSFISRPTDAHEEANKILRTHASANGVDLLKADFIVKSLTRLGDYDER